MPGLETLWRDEYIAKTMIEGHPCVAASISHTAYLTEWNRRKVVYNGKAGLAAELEIIRDAASLARVSTLS
jgi:hypothetical protein